MTQLISNYHSMTQLNLNLNIFLFDLKLDDEITIVEVGQYAGEKIFLKAL